MERGRVLDDLKKLHQFPDSFVQMWPKEAAFIWSCLATNPDLRPSTCEILESEILDVDEDEVMSKLTVENERLRNLFRIRDEETERLKQESLKYEVQIEQLKLQLQSIQMSSSVTFHPSSSCCQESDS